MPGSSWEIRGFNGQSRLLEESWPESALDWESAKHLMQRLIATTLSPHEVLYGPQPDMMHEGNLLSGGFGTHFTIRYRPSSG